MLSSGSGLPRNLCLLLLLLFCLPALCDEGEALRTLLKAPLVAETGNYASAEHKARLRATLIANPKLANQPIFQLQGQQPSTPLVEAAKTGNVDAVRLLLEFKARPNLALGDRPVPPLQACIASRTHPNARLAVIRLLLGAGASPKFGLHQWAACLNWTDRQTYFAAADALVEAKAALNIADETGSSPLQIAIVNDNVSAVEKLLALGAVVDASSKESALAGAGTSEGDKILKLLKLTPRPKP
jgi:ankyrin repeat protein